MYKTEESMDHRDPYHDVMREALSQMTASAIPHVRNSSEQHLSPPDNRVSLSNDPMQYHGVWSYRPFVNMKLEVDPEHELRGDEHHHDVRERSMSRPEEFSTTVHVSKEVPSDG